MKIEQTTRCPCKHYFVRRASSKTCAGCGDTLRVGWDLIIPSKVDGIWLDFCQSCEQVNMMEITEYNTQKEK